MELFARKCTCCGNGMNKGFVVVDSYYCSEECRRKEVSDEDYNEAYQDLGGQTYYTEWEDKSDYDYKLVDGVLIEIDDEKK